MATYTIKYGDTLSGIARQNNTDVNTLMGLNPYITNANKIYAGKSLVLPDAQLNQTVAQPTVTQTTTQPTTTQAEINPATTNNTVKIPSVIDATKSITNQVNKATSSTVTTPFSQIKSISNQISNTLTPAKTTQQLAQDYANQQTEGTNAEGQALLKQYEKIAEQQKLALENQRQLTANQINSQRDEVMQNYNNNARQAYINSMLGKKQVEQELSRAGLNTSGLVGSAYANVENAYGNNLANLQTARDNSINNINQQLNNAKLQYDIQENQLLADIGNAKLDLQKYNNQLAYQKYQDAINNYMNFVNFDYSKYTNDRNFDYNKAIDERDFNYNKEINERDFNHNKLITDRNYNYQVGRDAIEDNQWQRQYDYNKAIADRNYNYQMGRDKVEDDQWLKEYELALKKANSSGSSSRSSSRSSSSSSKTGNNAIPEDKSSNSTGYELTELRDNVLAIKNPQGKYSTLTITPGATREQVLTWGRRSGLDLSEYDLSKYNLK